MKETGYTQIPFAGMFKVTVERTMKHDSGMKIHYEFAYAVEVSTTGNDFIDVFAGLVAHNGKMSAKRYAAMMGTGERPLMTTLLTLSGAGIREWTDAFASAIAEALLRGTDWPVGSVAEAARFGRTNVFCKWFRLKYKCTPGEWRLRRR